jgi:hypothetical protein
MTQAHMPAPTAPRTTITDNVGWAITAPLLFWPLAILAFLVLAFIARG